MPYLVETLLFLAPFAGFALWRLLNPGHALSAAVIWLSLAGVGCGIGGAIWYGQYVSLRPGSVYVPARLGSDGTVVPGHAEPRR